MAGYSTTPLVKKLGIEPQSTLALLSAPRGFRAGLDLPPAVRVSAVVDGAPDVAIWFVTTRADLAADIAAAVGKMGRGLWIAWPKRTSGVTTDLTENVVRNVALPHGIVDYKVCAIDDTWSGLKFARRRSDPATPRRRGTSAAAPGRRQTASARAGRRATR